MFNLNDSMRYYLYPYPTDMRKSFYTLSGVVKDLMGHDVRNGDIFIFVGRTCSSMKIRHMECGGLVIYHLQMCIRDRVNTFICFLRRFTVYLIFCFSNH